MKRRSTFGILAVILAASTLVSTMVYAATDTYTAQDVLVPTDRTLRSFAGKINPMIEYLNGVGPLLNYTNGVYELTGTNGLSVAVDGSSVFSAGPDRTWVGGSIAQTGSAATGVNSVALGQASTAGGELSLTHGFGNASLGDLSTVWGLNSFAGADALYGTAFGNDCTTLYEGGVAFGRKAVAQHAYSIVMSTSNGDVASTDTQQITLEAVNGIRLLGGPTTVETSTNETAALNVGGADLRYGFKKGSLIASSGTLLLDCSQSTSWDIDLQADTWVTLQNVPEGYECSVKLRFQQDSTGGHQVTIGHDVYWQGGAVPEFDGQSNSVDVVWLTTSDAGGVFDGFHAAQTMTLVPKPLNPASWELTAASAWTKGSGEFDTSSWTDPKSIKTYGRRVYCVSGDEVLQYTLPEDYNIENMSYEGSYTFTGKLVRDVSISDSGTKAYITSKTNPPFVIRYDLSVPWDITSASYAQQKQFNYWGTNPNGIEVSPDGTRMIVTTADSNTSDEYYRSYTMSTAGNLDTATQTSSKYCVVQVSLNVNESGTQFYDWAPSSYSLYVHTLDEPWGEVANETITSSTISGAGGYVVASAFANNGEIAYIMNPVADKIYQFTTDAAPTE